MTGWLTCRRWLGHGWQVAVGWDRLRLWLDYRGPVLDVGPHRLVWVRPGLSDRDLLFHQRRIPTRWYGRAYRQGNPTWFRAKGGRS